MEQQIQDLVASIKKDGIEQAKKESELIINQAKAQAEEILQDAKKKAAKLITDSENEVALRDQSARATLKQAARDVSLSLKKEIESQLMKILQVENEKGLKGENLVKLIADVVKSSGVEAAKTNIEVNPADTESVSKGLVAVLKKEMESGLEIKAVKSVDYGFRVSQKDGSGYFDLSSEEIARLLTPFISPVLQDIIFN